MHLLKSLLNFSSSTGLQHLKMARDQKILLKASREHAGRTITQEQKGRNLIKVPAEVVAMIRVAIVTNQWSLLSYPPSLTSLPDANAHRKGGWVRPDRLNIFI